MFIDGSKMSTKNGAPKQGLIEGSPCFEAGNDEKFEPKLERERRGFSHSVRTLRNWDGRAMQPWFSFRLET